MSTAAMSRSSTTAVPSSSGWATNADGSTQSTPRAAQRKKGESRPIGWIAEQRSCRKPGNVNSAVRTPPPACGAASCTSTSSPARTSVSAPARPFGPEPITMALQPFWQALPGKTRRRARKPILGKPRPVEVRLERDRVDRLGQVAGDLGDEGLAFLVRKRGNLAPRPDARDQPLAVEDTAVRNDLETKLLERRAREGVTPGERSVPPLGRGRVDDAVEGVALAQQASQLARSGAEVDHRRDRRELEIPLDQVDHSRRPGRTPELVLLGDAAERRAWGRRRRPRFTGRAAPALPATLPAPGG